MKLRFIWLATICSLLWAIVAHADIYMGTASKGSSQPNFSGSEHNGGVPFAYSSGDSLDTTTCQPFSGKGPMPPNPCVGKLVATHVTKPMIITIHSGSLKTNVEKIVRQGGWGVPVWRPNYDFKWVGNVTITGKNIQDVLAKLLEPYPLQAVFYEANHVVEIVPRRSS